MDSMWSTPPGLHVDFALLYCSMFNSDKSPYGLHVDSTSWKSDSMWTPPSSSGLLDHLVPSMWTPCGLHVLYLEKVDSTWNTWVEVKYTGFEYWYCNIEKEKKEKLNITSSLHHVQGRQHMVSMSHAYLIPLKKRRLCNNPFIDLEADVDDDEDDESDLPDIEDELDEEEELWDYQQAHEQLCTEDSDKQWESFIARA
ncbi:hypothetical protein CPB84DRAFT_1748786 [Gymnopilus junonius]|uniref:Uncharacterized protein n=1 Tax=Gymnopilus junonius TaxID=109634 RepID=A0A9P5TKE1_GYMJU|nr:hypothetical protein CPB84DRAFT_1748786 [Gymnopilus junonius]